jgi:ankyrin repeat protein
MDLARRENMAVEVLKNSNFDINKRYGDSSLLQLAVKNDQFETVRYLVKHGAKIVQTFDDVITLARPEHFLNTENALTYAKTPRMAQFLIDHGADINVGSGYNRRTLLFESARRGDLELVKFCIRNNSDVNQPLRGSLCEGISRATALEVACQCCGESRPDDVCQNPQYVTIIKFLVQNGALINREDAYDDNALVGAVLSKNKEVVEFLLKNGANVKVKLHLLDGLRISDILAEKMDNADKRNGNWP